MTDGREQTQQTLNSKTSKADKKKTDCAMKEEIDSIKMNERFNTLCRNVIKENEQFHNLEVRIRLKLNTYKCIYEIIVRINLLTFILFF